MRLRGALLCIFSSVLLLTSASAQTSTGNIAGRVTDPTGALLPGVKITAKNFSAGTTRSVSTESSGAYSILNLAPGEYQVTAEAAGFASQQISPVTVNVGGTTTVDVGM